MRLHLHGVKMEKLELVDYIGANFTVISIAMFMLVIMYLLSCIATNKVPNEIVRIAVILTPPLYVIGRLIRLELK